MFSVVPKGIEIISVSVMGAENENVISLVLMRSV